MGSGCVEIFFLLFYLQRGDIAVVIDSGDDPEGDPLTLYSMVSEILFCDNIVLINLYPVT